MHHPKVVLHAAACVAVMSKCKITAPTANISSAASRKFRGKCKFVFPERRDSKFLLHILAVAGASGVATSSRNNTVQPERHFNCGKNILFSG
jgi:hypothetical protein